MVFELLSGKAVKVPDLLAKKKYPEALALLQEQMKTVPGDTSLRMQTADVLILLGRIEDAAKMLEAVANDFAMQGFAAKAIAVLKKIQKLDPGRHDLESKIVDLLKTTAPAAPKPSAIVAPEPSMDFGMVGPEDGDAIDLGFDLQAPSPSEAAPAFDFAAAVAAAPAAISFEEPAATPAVAETAFTAISFTAAEQEEEEPARRTSPLFDDFSQDELLDVMRGLELLTYEPGDIIVTEGQKGDSLFVLTSGTAKAFVHDKEGGSTQVRQLNEGDFFGEISILTGKPRTATITSAAHCELLRLDRATLDEITRTHPRVREVLQRFYEERTHNTAEVLARGLDAGSSDTLRQAGLADDQQEAAPVEVVVAVQEQVESDPTEARLLHLRNMAIEQTRKQNWADAVQAWQQYIAIRPADTDAANALGVLFGKLGRWKDAAQTFEKLVVVNSKDATLLFNLGLSYRNLDLLPQAAQAFRQAIALKPDYDKARQGLASVVTRIKKGAG